MRATDGGDAHWSHLAAAVEWADEAVVSLDLDGRVVECNRAAARVFGLSEEALQRERLEALVAEYDRSHWTRFFSLALGGVRTEDAELAVRTRAGSAAKTRITLVPLRVDGGAVIGVTLVLRDLTEQLMAQATLAESAQRIAESEALSHVGSWAWDARSDVVQWSEELHRIHGVDPLEFDGTLSAQVRLVHPDDRVDVRADFAAALNQVKPFEREFRVVRPDGVVRWVYGRATVVTGPDGHGLGLRGIYQDITERHANAQVLQETNERLTQLALYDRLTGLPNRALLVDRLRTSLERARRRGERVDVLYMDVDDFKTINDIRGHHAGDEVLAALASRLQEAVRVTDTVSVLAPWTMSRLHGDEFAVVLENCTDVEEVTARIAAVLKPPLQLSDGGEVFLSVSIGTATAFDPESGDSPDALLAAANMAMHEAKRTGKSRHMAFEPWMHELARFRLELGDELHRAIRNQEFELVYQPVVDLAEGLIVGAEALLRWQHPQRGMVPPDVFIGRAEETGLILPLGRWVLSEAVRQAAEWAVKGHPEFTVAVNVSGRQLREPSFADSVREALAAVRLDPAQLCLEITESVLMERDDDAIEMLAGLRGEGVHLAIDDFGTGYSSLGALRRLPADLLKIDRSFVASLPEDDDAGTIAWAVVRLGHTLGMPVLAEGVETEEQYEALRRFGCDQAQGYLFGRPMPAVELEALLSAQRGEAETG